MSYIINKWAIYKRGELSVTPDDIIIHTDFLQNLSHEEFEVAFRQVGDIFYRIMTDISNEPERFAMPLCDESTTRYGAPEAQESRFAAWRPMKLLYSIFTNGNARGSGFQLDISAFKIANRLKNTHLLFEALVDYGFAFEGLTKYKITPKTTELIIYFPDNPNVITVLALLAKKTAGVGIRRIEEQFYSWSYRLLCEGFGVFSYTDAFYAIYDKERTEQDREFIRCFHEVMKSKGYFYQSGGGNEGPGIRYYDKESVMKSKGPYMYQLWDNKGELQLYMRIRNAQKCIDLYMENEMPSQITEMFRHSDPGCGNTAHIKCNMGVGYFFEGQPRWHCGCCGASFWLNPKAENIDHYIKLVQVGEKR